MEVKWCWRCKCDIPMLNEEEYSVAYKLFWEGLGNFSVLMNAERFCSFLKYYEEVTGVKEKEPNTVLHHRISLYGMDCPNCSKPLRTPKARYCAACGFGIEDFKNGDERPLVNRMEN